MREKQDNLCLRLVPSNSQRCAPDFHAAFALALAFEFTLKFAFRVETVLGTHPERYCYRYDYRQLHRNHHALYVTERTSSDILSPAAER